MATHLGKLKILRKFFHFNEKDFYMNTAEKFHIYKRTVNDSQLNDKYNAIPNEILNCNSENHNTQV